jgi:SpoVK/Ycf46/Vps4 family AAA+-type ATPase
LSQFWKFETHFPAGVIFLTTNRLTTFDQAFESRIQFKLFYDPLTPAQRAKIWKTLLPPRIVPQSNPVETLAWDKEALLRLGQNYDINGREIKNMIKTAHALAEAAGQTLDEEHLNTVKLINDKWHAKAEENSKQTVSEQKHQCTCIGSSPGEI